MKAKYPGRCNLCGSGWPAGELVTRWAGKWVHEPCKAARVAIMPRLELPEARGAADQPQMVGVKAVRQAGISRTRQLG